MTKGPILFDLEPDPQGPEPGPAPNVADAPPVPDFDFEPIQPDPPKGSLAKGSS